jgi:DNA gyrase/topoisomerase IV subunit B
MKMGKIVPLIQAIGLIPGKRADRSQLKYGRVIIATDADTDGGDIFTTLVCLFYQFWPELFDPNQPPFIFRLLAPNVAATKRDKRVHFVTKKEFEANVHKYKGWNISYYKGLGSLIVEDWEMIIDNEKCLVPALLFSKDVQARQDWLS